MADVQLEHGYTKIANEILDMIQHFQFTQNQYKLLMALWRNTYGWNRKECEFSLSYIESVTNLERKRVSEALKALIQNNVIVELNPGSTTKTKIVSFNKNYEEWTIKRYKGSGALPTSSQDDTSGETPPSLVGNSPPLKERLKTILNTVLLLKTHTKEPVTGCLQPTQCVVI